MKKWSLDRKLETSRRNHARRCYKKAPLLALLLIRERYPDYSERQLLEDLKLRSKPKVKKKKAKTKNDFRSRQLDKYEILYRTTEPGTKEYNRVCNYMAQLTDALNARRDMIIHVAKGTVKYDYFFKWKTSERLIIEFITLAKNIASTHEDLVKKQLEIQKITAGLLAG